LKKSFRPKSFKIGSYRYKIKFVDGLVDEKNKRVCGLCHFDEKIEIESSQATLYQRSTLLHEILHTVNHYLGIKQREIEVTSQANLLFDALRANPQVLRYLFTQSLSLPEALSSSVRESDAT
jgi:hypothetical protein